MNAELILMIGVSGSGKSTFSKKLAEEKGIERISSDELRARFGKGEEDQAVSGKVFGYMKAEVRKILSEDKKVIVDATNYSVKNRADFVDIAKELGVKVTAYCFQVSLETAKARNKMRPRQVPEEVIAKQLARLCWPTPEEVDSMSIVTESGEVMSVVGSN